jgi:hypothetical protein
MSLHRLHKRITNGRAHEAEAAPLQVFAHGIGFHCARRKLPHRAADIHARAAADELPDIGIEAAKLLHHREKGLRVADGRRNLQPVAHDAGVAEQRVYFALTIARDNGRIEIVEYFAVALALAQDGVPAEAGLRAFEHQKLEQQPVVVYRHAPLLVVVANREFIFGPCATLGHI